MYKLAFLGGGTESIAGYVHLIASQMDRKFEVVGGIFSRESQKSQMAAQEYKVKHFDSIAEMCEQVDIVVVLTPTPEHYRNITELLRFDVGIIVDKPIVSELSETLIDENKFIVVTHNYSGYPLVRELKELIRHAHLGEIKKIKINMPQESFFKPMKPGYPQQWRIQDKSIPTISLDLGVHVFHLLEFLYPDDIVEVFAECSSFSRFDVIDDYDILVRSKNIKAVLSFSKISLGNRNELSIEVYGNHAGAKWEHSNPEELIIAYTDGKREVFSRGYAPYEAYKKRYNRMAPGHMAGFIEAFANLYVDIEEAFTHFKSTGVFQSNAFVYDAAHSYKSLKFLDLAKESTQKGKWIEWK